MIHISQSQEWVLHERSSEKAVAVRKFQKVAWDLLFKNKKDKDILFELNNTFLPSHITLIVFDIQNPENAFAQLKELMSHTDYDIHLTIKPKQ